MGHLALEKMFDGLFLVLGIMVTWQQQSDMTWLHTTFCISLLWGFGGDLVENELIFSKHDHDLCFLTLPIPGIKLQGD